MCSDQRRTQYLMPACLCLSCSLLQLRMGQVLAALWPAPFAADLTSPRGALVAHSGVSQVASDLFDQLRPYLDQGADAGLPLCFAGHSLGGSLGTLIMAHHALASRR
jgi:hypothetical protein